MPLALAAGFSVASHGARFHALGSKMSEGARSFFLPVSAGHLSS